MRSISNWFSLKNSALALATMAVIGVSGNKVEAQEKLWFFEVEVLLFARDVNPSALKEQFGNNLNTINTSNSEDLLSSLFAPDISLLRQSLAACHAPSEQSWATQMAASILAAPQPEEEPLTLTSLSKSDTDSGAVAFQPDTVEKPESTQTNNDIAATEPSGQADPEKPPLISIPASIFCQWQDEYMAYPSLPARSSLSDLAVTPTVIDGFERPYDTSTYLLSDDSLQFKQLYRDMRNSRDLSPLLHLGWRQEVEVGADNAQPIRLFAGRNYAAEFLPDGAPRRSVDMVSDSVGQLSNDAIGSSDDFFTTLRRLLDGNLSLDDVAMTRPQTEAEQPPVLEPIWQVDGQMKVFLRYIQSVPYLHIDSQLDFRAPVVHAESSPMRLGQSAIQTSEVRLQSFPFNQIRRVISTQLHYFDHPMFGMVVQIRRYTPLERPQDSDLTETEMETK